MPCVPARTCKYALAEATELWPNRGKASDGICGDDRHQRRTSDHNQGNAFDLTHDPVNGVDCARLAQVVKDDPRTKYVIWNRRIHNRSVSDEWRPYSGPNPHTHHMHVSIKSDARDTTTPWFGGDMTQEEHDWLGRIHHELVAEAQSVRALVKQLAADVAELKKKTG